MLDLTRCRTLHSRLSTTLSSCQTTKLYLCLMGIKQLVLRILHLQREGKRQPKKAVYMYPLVMDLISLFDFLTSSRGAAKVPSVKQGALGSVRSALRTPSGPCLLDTWGFTSVLPSLGASWIYACDRGNKLKRRETEPKNCLRVWRPGGGLIFPGLWRRV